MCQVDLDMLNVSLGTGTLEIRSALLNTDYLDAQLVRATPLWPTAAEPISINVPGMHQLMATAHSEVVKASMTAL